jgi:hypothetical protein
MGNEEWGREHPEFVNSHFLPPSHPPDVLGGNHSYSLPLITGALVRRGLGWGLLFMQKRDAPNGEEVDIGFIRNPG